LVYADDVNILGGSIHAIKKNTNASIDGSKEIGLEVNADKAKYMAVFQDQNVGRSLNIKTDNISFEMVEEFRYLGKTLTKQNSTQEEIKSRLKLGNACYYSMQNLLSSSLLSKYIKTEINRTVTLPVVYGCETWSLTLREKGRLKVFENRVLRTIFGPKRDEVTGSGEDYIMMSLMICTPHQILFG